MVAEDFTRTAIKHFIQNQPSTGVLGNKLNSSHENHMFPMILPHTSRLVSHLQNVVGGNVGSGGAIGTGGSLHTGGGLVPDDEDPKGLYHHMLTISPQKFEQYRELSAQMLGGVPSPMWDQMADGSEPLEGEPEDYENIIRMPNRQSAAKMIEAEYNGGVGGGFYKALKHVARKASGLYKVGRAALGFVNRNKELLLDLPGVRDYKEGISGFLDTASAIDEAVNPFVDAAIDAVKADATQADKDKLKSMATKSIDNAIETHLPEAKKYVQAAKDLNTTVQDIRRRPLYASQPVQPMAS